MKFRLTRCAVGIGGSMLLLAGCATTYEGPHSGFLPAEDYSLVHKESAPAGGDRYAYVSEKFTPANYHALILEPLQFYPAPEPNQFVTSDTLREIQTYANEQLHSKVGAKVRLVDTPGPGVARWKIAITAAGAEKRALKPYQYVPIALVLTGAKAAVQGGLPVDSTIALETEVVDSVTKATLAVVVRGGTGEEVEKNDQGQQVVTLTDLKKLIDAWTDSAAEQITKFVSPK